jgi:hypothetical protein
MFCFNFYFIHTFILEVANYKKKYVVNGARDGYAVERVVRIKIFALTEIEDICMYTYIHIYVFTKSLQNV